MIALYGVTWTDQTPIVDDLQLIWSDDRELVLIAGPEPREGDRAGALAFGRVIEQVASSTDVLPFRYGTTVQDAGAARKLLLEQAASWSRRLAAVRGCSELAVRV
ncbi:MAG: GvpL/GvpF family gas vesicle protein, partial [Nocardioides sp.]